MTTIWVTNPLLGSIPENQYYNLNLDTYDTTGSVAYALISGSLPGNLSLASDGNISGNTSYVNNSVTNQFTVRATNAESQVVDRTFTLTVISPVAPNITPNSGTLSTTIEGDFYSQQFSLDDDSMLANTTFFVQAGTIPPGLTVNANGQMIGYVQPLTSNTNYSFTIGANDGGKIDQNSYTLQVYERSTLTADSTYYSSDNVSIITADTSNLSNPVLLNSGFIGNVTTGDTFYYKLQGQDFDNANLTYNLVSGSLPSGLTLNSSSGWITGTVPTGSLISSEYEFAANVYKTDSPSSSSSTNSYSLRVLGEIDDRVIWSTESNIGSMFNGEISEFAVTASTPSGRQLTYTVITNVTYDPIVFESNRAMNYGLVSYGALPVGLELLADGTISGRASFEMNGNTGADAYVFTISASDSQGLIYGQKEFSIDVVERDKRPYENLYLTVLPTRSGRTSFDEIINNTDIVPPEYIYRPLDPWFGRNTLRRILFQTGLNPENIAEYVAALDQNHYWKNLSFGNLKTAIATDDANNILYEVVYLELIDHQVNEAGIGPNIDITWPTNTAGITNVYTNSFHNMSQRMTETIGYQNRSILPKWMTSRQPDGSVLGFTRGLIMCYTIPRYSVEVAYRINQRLANFNQIDLMFDRYQYDSVLSNNFVTTPAAATGNITANTQSNLVSGNSTIFSDELQVGSIVYVSNAAIGNVSSILSNSELTLYANSTANVSNVSYTYSNSFVVVNYTLGTGTITANTTSNVLTGNNANITGTGTITGISGNARITGTSTAFSNELNIGANIFVSGNTIGTIKSIISATILDLENTLTSNITDSSYLSDGSTTLFTTELHVGDVIINNSNVIIGTVDTISNNTSLVLTTNAAANISDSVFSHTTRDPYTTPGLGDKYLKFPRYGVL